METHPKAKQQEGRNKENQSRTNRSGGRIDRGMVSKDCFCSRMHRRVLTDVCWLEPAVKRQHVEMVWNGQPEREIQGLFFATCIGDVEWLACSCKSHCALGVLCHCDYCFLRGQFIEYLSTLFLMHCGKNKKINICKKRELHYLIWKTLVICQGFILLFKRIMLLLL